MYYFLFVFLLIAIFFLILFHFRKKKIIRKICCLSPQYKCCLLNEIAEPLGYCYDASQDIFTSTPESWQKTYGYGHVYDKAAPFLNMIFDCQPIYFDYDGKTWMIEFWKGQYGINTGSEIGIYHADRIIPPFAREAVIFSAADKDEYLEMSTELFYKGNLIARMNGPHWWQTIFSMGHFSQPEDLSMKITIRFPDFEMRNAFIEALVSAGYTIDSIHLCLYFSDVSFTFSCPHRHVSLIKRLYYCFVQYKNKCFCRLYDFATRPFACTCDKLLYLYYYLPFAFRRMLRLKRFRRRTLKPKKRKGE